VEHVGREQVRRTLAQLGRYFGDDSVRDEVQGRVRSAIGPDTAVVVAHSLGSVVAYEVLADASDRSVHLVTIGSALGQHGVVGDDLRPALRNRKGTWPAGVRTWTDITAVGDPVADGNPVADVFDGVVSLRVDNGHRAHDPEPYLCAVVTGAAIRAGLEQTVTSNRQAPPTH
jgi:pimeloyl-ACP methyl ester carboxylesterase